MPDWQSLLHLICTMIATHGKLEKALSGTLEAITPDKVYGYTATNYSV